MSDSPTTIDLPSQPNPEDVTNLLERLIGLTATPVVVSAERVATLTAPQLQVLLSAKSRWENDDTPFAVTSPSDGFTRCLKLFGLDTDFFSEKAKT